MKLSFQKFTLENKGGFKIAHGTRFTTETLFVGLSKNGVQGVGEAAHVPYYGITVEQSIALLLEKKTLIEGFVSEDFRLFNAFLHQIFGKNHYLICALDIAFHDLQAKLKGKRLEEVLGIPENPGLLSSYTMGIDTPEQVAQKVVNSDFEIIKIKLGVAYDADIIEAVRKSCTKTIRVDANAAWTTANAAHLCEVMVANRVEFVEQPFAKGAEADMTTLKGKFDIPFIADESCFGVKDVEKCAPFFDGINIKLTKCGGITPALDMIALARKLKQKVMIGCMSESSIGISAAATLAGLVDYADLDGALLIGNDPAIGTQIVEGKIMKSKQPGIGASLKNGII